MEIAEATTQPKRQRHEFQSHQNSSSNPNVTFLDDSVKRHKPYNTILNLLDDDDDEEQEQHEKDPRDQDLSAIFTTLERELASPSSPSDDHQKPLYTTAADISDLSQLEFYQDIATANDGSVATSADDEGEENVKSVMRHLLEASDDELGIPSNENNNEINISNEINNDQIGENMGPFGFNDENGFWEIEDEAAANYYTELHSELFM